MKQSIKISADWSICPAYVLGYQNISSGSIPDKRKEEFYFNEYLNFKANLDGVELIKMDEAFFAFGQFINTNKNRLLISQDLKDGSANPG